MNQDNIADPNVFTNGHSYRAFESNPLFSAAGPSMTDAVQGELGDCWLLAGLGAIANDNPMAIKQNVVDFDDGTYGVHLGDKFYRVDNELPFINSTDPLYAKLGEENSMWVAVVEKAFAIHDSFLNGAASSSYDSLEGGNAIDVHQAFGSTNAASKGFGLYFSATAMANDIFSHWNNKEAVTITFDTPFFPGVFDAVSTVQSVTRNASGVVTSITLRDFTNPYDNGLVAVTPAQLRSSLGYVTWGTV